LSGVLTNPKGAMLAVGLPLLSQTRPGATAEIPTGVLEDKIRGGFQVLRRTNASPDNDMFGVEASLNQRSGKDEKKKTE
jgi:hypothetical protein